MWYNQNKNIEENSLSAHIFIDAENVKPEIGFKAIEKFSFEYFVEQVEIIGNETNISNKYLESGNRYHIKNCFYGKNSADTWLCTEIAKTIFEKPAVDVIIIVSSDRDFLAAIKLVTDKQRKVILVSDGSGHKNLKALLYDLRINPDFIELVDFKNLAVEIPDAEKKKGVAEPVEIVSPNPNVNKVKELRKKNLPQFVQDFLTKNEADIQFISVWYCGKSLEIPFIEGVNFSTLTNILMQLKIIPNGKALTQIIDESPLKIENNAVFLDNDIKPAKPAEKPVQAEIKPPAPPKNPFNDVINYFTAHAAETKNIFIKCNGNLQEIPFVNGISLKMFSRLLKGYAISDNADEVKKIIADSFLDLREDKIYFHSEEKIVGEIENYLKKIPPPALEYIRKHEDKLKFVSIAHNNAVHKVPFVEGIPLSTFVNMLRELKIFGKSTSSQKVLTANGFTIKDNQVYKK